MSIEPAWYFRNFHTIEPCAISPLLSCLIFYCLLAILASLVNYQKALQAELDLVCRTLRICCSCANAQKGEPQRTHWIGVEHLTSSPFHGFPSIRQASPQSL